ncbi:MAG: beta-propeller fold lactonase family protein [Pseudomonadota bacterium]
MTSALRGYLLSAFMLATACVAADEATDDPASPAENTASSRTLVAPYTQQFTDRPIPHFDVDAGWPDLPDDMIFGQMPGVSVDRADNVWIIQRPNSLGFSDIGLDQDPPTAVCCRAAPHVLKFAQDGTFLAGWGGPEHAPDIDGVNQWPANVHGIYVDADDTVWIAGNGDGDHVVLNFDNEGGFIRQFGQRIETGGNFDSRLLGNPADITHDTEANETLIADGYINKRIIGFDTSDDAGSEARRIFGAYASTPDGGTRAGVFDQSQASSNTDGGADPASQNFGDIVHCVNKGPDGRIYVCDRRNNRIQVFDTDADSNTVFHADIVIAPETGGTRTVSDTAWSPDGAFLYIADMMNGQVWILDAESYEILGAVGRNGRYPGEFIWLHSVDVDSDGNLYTTEVNTGRRVQKFVFNGVE